MFRLGVYLDAALLIGAVAVLAPLAGRLGRALFLRLSASNGLMLYFVLAFVISWGAALLVMGSPPPGTLGSAPPAAAVVVFLAMLAGPTVASLVCSWLHGGAAGIGQLGRQLRPWRVPLRWYALPLLAPLVLACLLLALAQTWPAFSPAILTADRPGQVALAALVFGLGAGFFEELGWSGFVTPRLLARHRLLPAALILGPIWALWHALPDYWGSRGIYGGLWELHLLEWIVALTAYRVLMMWAYSRTRSLPLAMLLHATFTGGQLLLGPGALSASQNLAWYALFALALWIAAALAAASAEQPAGAGLSARAGAAAGSRTPSPWRRWREG